jgi:hypothetical protein
MSIELQIGMESWIVQDGNYPDFEVDQTYSFALEFYPHSLEKAGREKAFEQIENFLYKVTAEIVYIDRNSWVIDFGISAYQAQRPPKKYKVGDFVSGVFYLGVDHFAYFESLKNLKNYPQITNQWYLKEIELETTPFLETAPKYFERDKQNTSFESISKTDVWNDANGSGSYVFKCQLQNS